MDVGAADTMPSGHQGMDVGEAEGCVMTRYPPPTRHHVTPDLLPLTLGYQVPRRGRLGVVTRHDGSGELSVT